MAAGATSQGDQWTRKGQSIRNHLVVPGDHANPLLETATALEGFGALTTSPEDVGTPADMVARGENVTFLLTAIGEAMISNLRGPYLNQGPAEQLGGPADSPRSRAIEHLLAAQGHLIEARTAIEQNESIARNPQIMTFLGALTMFLGLVGEALYQLRNPAPKPRKWA
jgi:hypothetical protein